MKKIIIANNNGLTRLRAVELVQKGELMKDVAIQFEVHKDTISEWCKMYNEGGVERLNAPRKPRPKHDIDRVHLLSCIESCAENYKLRLNRLLRLANGEKLKTIAASEGVSVQIIMRDRQLFEAGRLPPEVFL